MGPAKAAMTFTDPPYNVNYGETMKDKIRNNSNKIINDNLGTPSSPSWRKPARTSLEFTDGAVYICMSSSELHILRRPLSPPVATGRPLSSGPRILLPSAVPITSANTNLFSMAGEKESVITGAATATRAMSGKWINRLQVRCIQP